MYIIFIVAVKRNFILHNYIHPNVISLVPGTHVPSQQSSIFKLEYFMITVPQYFTTSLNMRNVMLRFKQIHLFRQIEELINYCNFLTRLFCRRNVLPAFLNKRSPQEYNLKCNSCYVQLAFFWGDEIKSIVKKAQQEKVYSYINSFTVF